MALAFSPQPHIPSGHLGYAEGSVKKADRAFMIARRIDPEAPDAALNLAASARSSLQQRHAAEGLFGRRGRPNQAGPGFRGRKRDEGRDVDQLVSDLRHILCFPRPFGPTDLVT